jgi:DNA-binding CsgD family transcriptional regulator/tetratricopeptide (TPR) repeat protein
VSLSESSTSEIELWERSGPLRALETMLEDVAGDVQGRLALVYGEAGIGKTALVRRFADGAGESARVLWGRCDELFTPRPLGPVVDIAGALGGGLAEALQEEAMPFDVASALAADLIAQAPSVVVVEDAHLADEATLDVLRILGGRLADLPAMLVVTYRDDALERWHPLRVVLGEVATSRVHRLKLAPLSDEAVTSMASAHRVSGEELYRKTAGNPFFVTEALAAGDEHVPETVRDAVLGRVARLSGGAQQLLDAIAVTRFRGEMWLLEALVGEDISSLDEIVASGVVVSGRSSVSFRHELARLAVEEAIPAHRKQALHRRALELLADPPGGDPDLARLAHHAEAVGDGALVLEFAPAAATQASAMGAHREAADHLRRALRFADSVPLPGRAKLFARTAEELFFTGQFEAAASTQREAVACYGELGDPHREGEALAVLSQQLWQFGSLENALAAVKRSLALLEELPGPELVGACCQMAALQLAAEDTQAALTWALRAQRLAEDVDDPVGRLLALQAVGWVEFYTGASSGLDKLVQIVDTAKALGPDADPLAATAQVLIVRTACRLRKWDEAEPYLSAGIEFCVARDFDVWRYYLLGWKARLLLARGEWSEAARVAQLCLPEHCPFARIHALIALGQVRARLGDPDAWGPLDEALALAQPRNELQWTAQVAVARAEAAWLEGRHEDAIAETDIAYEGAAGTWWSAGLAYWRWRSGADVPAVTEGEEPYRLEMAGDWNGARERWQAIGAPYEAAIALLDAGEEGLQTALAEFRRLGTNPAAKIATARLRQAGVSVERGPHRRTRENPAGLTPREMEVLEVLAQGLRNADIAAELCVSERTVDHHVSAILGKLGADNRVQAVNKAAELGIAGQR